MSNFRMTFLILMSAITCSAAENELGLEAIENPSLGSEPLGLNTLGLAKTFNFRKYVSLDVLGLANLFARFNFGFRNEFGSNGYDLGISGGRGHKITMCGAYASYLHYFHPESAFNFYSGVGVDNQVLWGTWTYGANIIGVIPVGVLHKAKTGRNEFFQINILWPTISYFKIYRRDRYYSYFDGDGKLTRTWGYARREGKASFLKSNLITLGVTVNYGLFF